MLTVDDRTMYKQNDTTRVTSAAKKYMNAL
jgi:hypothetical protein